MDVDRGKLYLLRGPLNLGPITHRVGARKQVGQNGRE
jgi:hypothetical protein